MTILNRSFRSIATALACATLLGISVPSDAQDKSSVPDGFNHVLLYMGNGIFDPNSPAPRPGITDCVNGFCNGDFFQKEVAHRTDAQIREQENLAKAFFLKRFGIDVDDPANIGRITLQMFTFHPDLEYRLYIASSTRVPPEGWIVRDGGWKLEVIDPNGIDLGGEFAGQHANQGNLMFYGDYNILITNNGGVPKDELVIHYKSHKPAITTPDGMTFLCDVSQDKWGEGVGMGTFQAIKRPDGLIRANVRNALSFPPSSRVINFPKLPAYGDHPLHGKSDN